MFEEAYAQLSSNEGQKLAVDTIDGPVMVVAGPGTGKTQLLSVRVGNILRSNSTILPSNILCLTFTDSAAANLRERLIHGIGLGQEAYQVAVHTFNSFGAWVMTTYPEYFAAWREAATADELTTYRIVENILTKLSGSHVLSRRSPEGDFMSLRPLLALIRDCKQANISPQELRTILIGNEEIYDEAERILGTRWPSRMTGEDALARIQTCVKAIDALSIQKSDVLPGIADIGRLLKEELNLAASESAELPTRSQTKPYTAWKNRWLELNASGAWVMKARKAHEKLMAGAKIYEAYEAQLAKESMTDFSDQITHVLAALKQHDELRLNLQERFQYIMIDEYQDTNRAQLQLAQYLTDASVHEGRPNILVVGDDDQAIYRFQGADMSNITAFESAYRDPLIVNLSENYRSNEAIISPAKKISAQIVDSLATRTGIAKELRVNRETTGTGAVLIEASHESQHNAWIAQRIKQLIEKGERGSDIAILARKRDQLDNLVPYLRRLQIPIDYERRENVLDQPHIVALVQLARVVQLLSEDLHSEANALLPELLSHPMWSIEPSVLWSVSRQAAKAKTTWIEAIYAEPEHHLRPVIDFLILSSQQALTVPLDQILDSLIGMHPDPNAPFISPFKQYYFQQELFDNEPATYLTFLSHLSCLRGHLRNYQQLTLKALSLKDLIEFVDAYGHAGLTMIDKAPHRESGEAVKLLTAHKAKGMEFDTVFVIGVTDAVWNSPRGGGNSRFTYPANLQILQPSESREDDALRLLFVAMTRAKQSLNLCYYRTSEANKSQQVFAPILELGIEPNLVNTDDDTVALVQQYEERWLARHASVASKDKQALLSSVLENYQLSSTHLNNYLDVTKGGPLYFLTQSLLKFPSATSPSVAYGNAVHATIRWAHEAITSQKTPAIASLLGVFQKELSQMHLSEYDAAYLSQRGTDNLPGFFQQFLGTFSLSQRAEVNFAYENVSIGQARLRGAIDMIDLDTDTKKVRITDYKTNTTSTSFSKWELPQSTEEHIRIKAHHYKRQLLFYKLLIDGSSTWGKQGWRAETGIIQFVEPNNYGKINTVELVYSPQDVLELTQLIKAVWGKIMALDFPDTSQYSQDLAGIKAFEQDLITTARSY